MGNIYPIHNNFTAGEISPRMYGRSDITAYKNGLETCLNFIVLPYGGVTRRGGFDDVANCKTSTKNVRLIPWVFSEAAGQQYVLEVGYDSTDGGYIRVHRVDTHAYASVELKSTDTDSPIEWTNADIPNIRYVQKNDVMWFFDGKHPPLKLIRSGATQPGTWTIEAATFLGSPFELVNRLTYKVFQFDEDYYDYYKSGSNGITSSVDFEQFFTETPSIEGLSLNDSGTYPTTQNYGPLAWSDVAIYNTFPLTFPVDWWSFQLDGRLYIAETGIYRFALNSGHAGDLLIDSEFIVKDYGYHSTRIHGGAEFSKNASVSLTQGTHPFIARLVVGRGSKVNYGIAVAWRKEANSAGMVFTGSGTNNLTITNNNIYGNRNKIFEIDVFINSSDATKWGWRYRENTLINEDHSADAVASTASGGFNNGWYYVVGDGGTLNVGSGVINYNLQEPNSGRPASGLGVLATINIPSTGRQPGDRWTFKRGFLLISYEVFQQTEHVNATSYPRCAVFYQERLHVGGFPDKPNTVMGSKIGDYENFQFGTNANDAYEVQISSRQNDSIQWLAAARRMLCGTQSAEYTLGDDENPPSPTGFPITPHSHNGSKFVDPVVTEHGTILYVEKTGRRLRELDYKIERDAYQPTDVSIFAAHLLESGLKELAYCQGLETWGGIVNVCWAITETGTLLGLTLEKEQKVYAWHRHTYDNGNVTFESIAAIPNSSGYSELWAVVSDGTRKAIVYHKITQYSDVDLADPSNGVFTIGGRIIPLPQLIDLPKTAQKSWVELKVLLEQTYIVASTVRPRASREKTDAYSSCDIVEIDANITTPPEWVDLYLPGWDESGQFVFETRHICTILAFAGKLTVNER